MKPHTIQIEIKDLSPIKNILQLLDDNFDHLPKAVQDGLKEIKDKWLGPDEYHQKTQTIDGPTSCSIDHPVLKINTQLKKVLILNEDKQEKVLHLEHFWIKKGDTIIWEW